MTLASCGHDFGNDDILTDGPDQPPPGDARSVSCGRDRPARHGAIITEIMPHVPRLRRYLRQRLSEVDTDDLVQDVLMALIRRGGLADIRHPERYLFSAANAAMIDRKRRQKVRATEHHVSLEEIDHPVDELSPLRILLARDEVQSVEHRLSRLPDRTQEIVRAVRIDGSSYKDLASRYNLSTSAVEKHMTRGLRALMSGWGRDDDPLPKSRASAQRQRFLSGAM